MSERLWRELQIHFEPEGEADLHILKFATGFDTLHISIENEYLPSHADYKSWHCDSLTKEEAQSIIDILQAYVDG